MIHDHDDKPCGCKGGDEAEGHALGGAIPAEVARNLQTVADALRPELDPGMAELAGILRAPTNVQAVPAARVVPRTIVFPYQTANAPATPWQPIVQPSPDLLRVTLTLQAVSITDPTDFGAAFVYFTADTNLRPPEDPFGTTEISGIGTLVAGVGAAPGSIGTAITVEATTGLWAAGVVNGVFAAGTSSIILTAVAEYRD